MEEHVVPQVHPVPAVLLGEHGELDQESGVAELADIGQPYRVPHAHPTSHRYRP